MLLQEEAKKIIGKEIKYPINSTKFYDTTETLNYCFRADILRCCKMAKFQLDEYVSIVKFEFEDEKLISLYYMGRNSYSILKIEDYLVDNDKCDLVRITHLSDITVNIKNIKKY